MVMVYKFEVKVCSDIDAVKNVVEELLLNIKDRIDENIFFNSKLILYELMINGVLHGNKQDVSKQINVVLIINKSCIVIEITDEGSGIVYKHKSFGEYDCCESGRGLMLVECLSDKFTIEGNRVTCIQYLK